MLYLGVIGKPISHSLSPAMHNAVMKKLGISGIYLAFEVDDFEGAVRGASKLGFRGLNITIPYKENAYSIADEASDDVKIVKAGNTILFENNQIKVFNTDIYGFQKAVEKSGFKLKDKRIAIIGAGGAARAITYASLKAGTEIIAIFNRTYEKAVKIKEDIQSFYPEKQIIPKKLETINFSEFDIIVNATNIGWKNENLFEIIGKYPEKTKEKKLFFDTIYTQTKFLKIGKSLGYKTQDGRWMLVLQGAMSFKIWTSIYPDEEIMFRTLKKAQKVKKDKA